MLITFYNLQVGYDMTKSAAKKLFQKAGMYMFIAHYNLCYFTDTPKMF